MPGNGNGNGKHWARLQADLNCKLRRGAWYRVRELGPLEAVVEVKGKALAVPCAFLKVVEEPPRRWTIVPRPHDAVRYRQLGHSLRRVPELRRARAARGTPAADRLPPLPRRLRGRLGRA